MRLSTGGGQRFCRSLRSDAGEKLLARGPRGRPRLAVFHLPLELPALIVGSTEPLTAHRSLSRRVIHDLWISNAGVTSCTTVDGTSDYSRRLRQCQSEAWFPGCDACAAGRHLQLIVGRLKAAPTTVMSM